MQREQVERLYEQHGAALVAYGCALSGNRAAAEDAIQQVFLNLLKTGIAEPENPRAYLYRAVRNRIFNAVRGASREAVLDAAEAWFAAPAGVIENSLALQAALLELPAEQREVVVMRIWADLTFEEIAAVLAIPPNTAASRYRYGLAKLRERMQPRSVEKYAAKR